MSIALQFANLNLAIMNDDIEATKEATAKINELINESPDLIISASDLHLLSTSFNNKSFNYFLLNFKPNEQMDKELWYFLASFIPSEYAKGKLSNEEILNFIQTQIENLKNQHNNKNLKYYNLIRFAMLSKNYSIVNDIKTYLEQEELKIEEDII